MKYNYPIIVSLFLFSFFSMKGLAFSNEPTTEVKKLPVEENAVTSVTDPGWSYTCQDGVEVDLMSIGLKNNVPATLDINDTEGIRRIVVEIVYKGNNPGKTIEVTDHLGKVYSAERHSPKGGSSNVWYYRTEVNPTTAISYKNTAEANSAQSLLAYVFKTRNNGVASSGVFTALSGYNNIETTTIPIQTDTGPRPVIVQLPISELTPDGRYIHIEVSAADGSFTSLTETIDGFDSGQCCIKIFELKLNDVAGDVDEITIKIDTRNKKNGQTVNGQSWIMGGAIKTDVRCSCVDFDEERPTTAAPFTNHILLEDISLMPQIAFVDNCSAVLVKYEESEDVVDSYLIDYGPQNATANVFLRGLPFDENHHWDEGFYQQYSDGTTKIHGTILNNTDTSSGWLIEIYFEKLVDFNTWVSQGGYVDSDNLKNQRQYAKVDFTKPYTFTGFGKYKYNSLTLLENTNFHHMDIGPRDEYGDNGIGMFISYNAMINGQTNTNNDQKIEMYAGLTGHAFKRQIFIMREWKVRDAARNYRVFIQRVELEYED